MTEEKKDNMVLFHVYCSYARRRIESISNMLKKLAESQTDTVWKRCSPEKRDDGTEETDETEKFPCKVCNIFLITGNARDTHEKYCRSKPELRDTKKAESRDPPATEIRSDLKGMFRCDHCDYQTVYKGRLKRHFNIHFPNLIFVCKFCEKKFSSKYCLESHYVHKHPENLSDVTVTNKINICDVCGYKRMGSLKEHHKKHRRFDEFSFQCEICQRLFKFKGSFEKHLDTHSSLKKIVCLGCERRFTTKYNLDNHIIAKHSDNNNLLKTVTSKIHSCSHCQYRTCISTHLIKHTTKCSINHGGKSATGL